MVDATQAKCLLAACILLLADILRIGECSLIISRACASGDLLQARFGLTWGKTSAACKVILCRLGAGEASRLAPAEQACCLAVLEAIVGHCVVALGASRADAKIRLHARSELVMVDATQAKCLLAAPC